MPDQFPAKDMAALGFNHIEINGQKAYHGVATLSRIPIERDRTHDFNGTGEARHLAVRIDGAAGNIPPVTLHNFYVPAGGDVPDSSVNPKFGQKLTYLSQMADWFGEHKAKSANRMIMVGDLNVAPLETDV